MANSSDGMRVYRFEEPIARSLDPRQPAPRRRRRRVRWPVLLVLAVVVAVVAGAVAFLGRPTDGRIPVGTTIGGVDVGGMTRAEAKAAARAHGEEAVSRGLILTSDGNRFQMDTAALRLRPNAQVAAAKAVVELGFVDRVRMRLGLLEPREIPLRYLYNPGAFTRATLPVRQAVTVAPQLATIGPGPAFSVTPAADGRQPDMRSLRVALRDYGATGPVIDVPVKVVPPGITTDEANVAAEKARSFVRTRHVTVLRDDVRLLPREVAVKIASFSANGRNVEFVVSRAGLRAYFSSIYGKRERAPINARFTVNAQGGARIIGGRNGRGVDVDELARVWQANPEERRTPITFGIREPELTTEEARNLGVKQVVSTFFTPYSGGARVTNIKLAAKILDQHRIMPGQTFSLNEALGERTLARGFVEAPMIGEGHVLTDAIGGGVSQVATTTFNAAFFAGLKLIAHTPHSFWISRYPKGREATVSWGGPELIFQNNWDAPIVILTKTDESGIRVTFLSDRLGRRVEAIEGEPFAITPARTIRQRDRSLPPGTRKVQQPLGNPGFSITYGRKVFKNGKLISKQQWTWRYVPENAVILIGPKVQPTPTPEPDPNDPTQTDTTSADSAGAGEADAATVPQGAN